MPELTPPPPARRRPPRRRPSGSGFVAGVARTLAIVGAFVGSGVVAGSLAGAPGPTARPAAEHSTQPAPPAVEYPSPPMEARTAEPRVWLVDGFNALHVALLRGRDRPRWWRGEERERLVAEVARFDASDAEVVVVFDGPRPAEDAPGEGPRVVFAPSADDWLLREVRDAPEPGAVAVVTADRQLADRARHRGARVVSPRVFLERCGSARGSI